MPNAFHTYLLPMLINFELTPLQNVAPWGEPDNLGLSWFGLTDGQYWISAGEASLFEYSEHARSAGARRYCDYQIARLLEDILDMLPSVMEPVPPALVQYLSGDSGKKWRNKLSSWSIEQFDVIDEDEYWRLTGYADALSFNRFLDSAFKRASGNAVTTSWDEVQRAIMTISGDTTA
ncbi:DUF5984 family protein [Pseudoduganella rivuli]|nr:DUF5984 family protein [Pseudoduganella rivuli]